MPDPAMRTPTDVTPRVLQLARTWGCSCGRRSLTEWDVGDLMTWAKAVLDWTEARHDSHEPVAEAQAVALMDALGSSDNWVGELMDAAIAWEPLGYPWGAPCA